MMVREVTRYEDSSGKDHKTEHAACRADLALLLASSTHVNQGQAQQLVDWLDQDDDRADDLINGLKSLRQCRPPVETAADEAPAPAPAAPPVEIVAEPEVRDI